MVYVEHLQWDRMKKGSTAWDDLYGAGAMGMGDTIYARDGEKLTETACLTRVPWFGKFMKDSKLRMGVIKKQGFGVSS